MIPWTVAFCSGFPRGVLDWYWPYSIVNSPDAKVTPFAKASTRSPSMIAGPVSNAQYLGVSILFAKGRLNMPCNLNYCSTVAFSVTPFL